MLVVNDDPIACEMLVRMVRAKGFDAIGAPASDEAIARMADELPRCVVLDLDAGGMGTSLKVLDTIRSHDDLRVRSARVVLCAASPRNRAFSFQSGTDAFLVRPFHLDELTDQIADVVARPQEDRARHRRDELARHGDWSSLPHPQPGRSPPPPRDGRLRRRGPAVPRPRTTGPSSVLGSDARVKEVQVGGSIGSGSADAWSDLDIVVVTHPEQHDAFLADRDAWLSAITPTVFARTPIAPFIINTITDEGLTFDISVWADAAAGAGRHRRCATPSGCWRARQFADIGAAARLRGGRAAPRHERTVHQPAPARGAPPSPHGRPAPARPAHDGVPRRDGCRTAGEALERHLHRGATRGGRRLAAGERARARASIAFGLGLGELLVTRARPLYPRHDLVWPADLARSPPHVCRSSSASTTGAWLY